MSRMSTSGIRTAFAAVVPALLMAGCVGKSPPVAMTSFDVVVYLTEPLAPDAAGHVPEDLARLAVPLLAADCPGVVFQPRVELIRADRPDTPSCKLDVTPGSDFWSGIANGLGQQPSAARIVREAENGIHAVKYRKDTLAAESSDAPGAGGRIEKRLSEDSPAAVLRVFGDEASGTGLSTAVRSEEAVASFSEARESFATLLCRERTAVESVRIAIVTGADACDGCDCIAGELALLQADLVEGRLQAVREKAQDLDRRAHGCTEPADILAKMQRLPNADASVELTGFKTASAEDSSHFRIRVSAHEPVLFYVFGITAGGRILRIFPAPTSTSGDGPSIAAGSMAVVPADGEPPLPLDTPAGKVVGLYRVASYWPAHDLERIDSVESGDRDSQLLRALTARKEAGVPGSDVRLIGLASR